jgi:hypothetical protein
LTLWLVAGASPVFAQPGPIADRWLTNRVTYPARWSDGPIQTNAFIELRAEAVAEKLVVRWTPDAAAPTGSVAVLASPADLSHWPTRDWRSFPMVQAEGRWLATIPVEDVEVPIAYFVFASGGGTTNRSPMRAVVPRDAGLEEPTRVFWPFLEGFEQGIDSWRIISKDRRTAALQTNAAARNGRFALSVAVPAARRSVTVGTTRVRGWQLGAESATGLRVWLRTAEGKGRARFSLVANTGAANEAVASWPDEVELNDRWQSVELQFSQLPGLPLGDVDLFAVDFTAEHPGEFLIDDLQLLGPWKFDLE